jgi:hypothetical protein
MSTKNKVTGFKPAHTVRVTGFKPAHTVRVTGLKPARSVRPGHVARAKTGVSYVAKGRTPGSRHWVRASNEDVKCDRYLKRTIRKLTHEAKHKESKRIRTIPQAIAVSYSKTQKKYPKCELVKRQSAKSKSVTNKSKKAKRGFLDMIFG